MQTPMNVHTAAIVPTISSPYGSPHICDNAKYRVPRAGNSMVQRNFRVSYSWLLIFI